MKLVKTVFKGTGVINLGIIKAKLSLFGDSCVRICAFLERKCGIFPYVKKKHVIRIYNLIEFAMIGTTCKSLLIAVLMFFSVAYAQKKDNFVKFINEPHEWVDSVFNDLSPKERIAQLFLVRAHTNLGQAYIDSVADVIKKEQLGGLVLFQGGPKRHVEMINRYQSLSKVPLLNTIDGEWGLGMRLPDSTVSYPYQMTLGAVQDDELLYEMGKQVAKDLKRMGIHFNFAPVVDVNNNPRNPVIGFRSFGDDKINVTKKAKAYMQGMMDERVISSLKHFPGHGDTDVDSHHDLPQLNFNKARLDSLEIYPFSELIEAGAPAVMVAHMNIPALDDSPNMPSSISKKVVTDLLKNEIGFSGLVVTDAMDMNGVKKFFPNGEADVMAIEAGHDLLEISENSGRAIEMIEKAIASGRISKDDIERRVKKVLAAKYWLGLDKYRPTVVENLLNDLNRKESKELVQTLADNAVTVIKSDKGIKRFDVNRNTAVVSIGLDKEQAFEEALGKELSEREHYFITGDETKQEIKDLIKKVRKHRQIVLSIHDIRARPANTLKLSENSVSFINKIAGRRTVTVLFTNPYVLDQLPVQRSATIIMGYQNDDFIQKSAAKVLTGKIKANGRLPVTVNKKFRRGQGF